MTHTKDGADAGPPILPPQGRLASFVRDHSVLAGAVALMGLVGLELLEGTFWPGSMMQWAAFIVAAPVLIIVFGIVGELVHEGIIGLPVIRHARAAVMRRTAARSLSWLRVGYLLVEALMLVIIAALALVALSWVAAW